MADTALVRMNTAPAGRARLYKWREDNGEELNKERIKQENTIKAPALQLNLDPRALEQTIYDYNRGCKNGVDKTYHRNPEKLLPLSTPPFYGVQLLPGGPNTQGGPRRNGRDQVLRPDGFPIHRLYSAGELGSIYGMLYPGSGGNLAECIAFGRIAGENLSELRAL